MVWLLLFSIVFGGTQSPILDQHFEKMVKKNIPDKEKQEHILNIASSYQHNGDVYNQNKKQTINELEYKFDHKTTPINELEEAFYGYLENEKTLDRKTINCRLKLQKYIEDSVWHNILKGMNSELKEHEKDLNYTHARIENRLYVMRANLTDNIVDKDELSIILKDFDEHSSNVLASSKIIRNLRIYQNDTIRNIQSSRVELESLYQKRYELQTDLFKTYLSFHHTLVNHTTEKEWITIQHNIKPTFY